MDICYLPFGSDVILSQAHVSPRVFAAEILEDQFGAVDNLVGEPSADLRPHHLDTEGGGEKGGGRGGGGGEREG